MFVLSSLIVVPPRLLRSVEVGATGGVSGANICTSLAILHIKKVTLRPISTKCNTSPVFYEISPAPDMALVVPNGYSPPAYPNTHEDQAGPAVTFVVAGLVPTALVMFATVYWVRKPSYVASLSVTVASKPILKTSQFMR